MVSVCRACRVQFSTHKSRCHTNEATTVASSRCNRISFRVKQDRRLSAQLFSIFSLVSPSTGEIREDMFGSPLGENISEIAPARHATRINRVDSSRCATVLVQCTYVHRIFCSVCYRHTKVFSILLCLQTCLHRVRCVVGFGMLHG